MASSEKRLAREQIAAYVRCDLCTDVAAIRKEADSGST